MASFSPPFCFSPVCGEARTLGKSHILIIYFMQQTTFSPQTHTGALCSSCQQWGESLWVQQSHQPHCLHRWCTKCRWIVKSFKMCKIERFQRQWGLVGFIVPLKNNFSNNLWSSLAIQLLKSRSTSVQYTKCNMNKCTKCSLERNHKNAKSYPTCMGLSKLPIRKHICCNGNQLHLSLV